MGEKTWEAIKLLHMNRGKRGQRGMRKEQEADGSRAAGELGLDKAGNEDKSSSENLGVHSSVTQDLWGTFLVPGLGLPQVRGSGSEP